MDNSDQTKMDCIFCKAKAAGELVCKVTGNYHRWSGWPGAFCLDCFCEDPLEQCLADGCMCDCHPRLPEPVEIKIDELFDLSDFVDIR
jgi:hypothetical protein